MSGLLTIQSHKGPYEVRFSDNFADDLRSELRKSDVFVIDQNVFEIYASRLQPLVAERTHFLVQPSENAKCYQAVGPLIERLIEAGFRKNHRLVAIGGGVVQDITAFIASILYRGVQWLFVPTNLLTQADSCIGSKVSINVGPYKNQLGGFHPPTLILNDQSLLATLPRDEIRSGMGEMLHYFLLDGREAFDEVKANYEAAFSDSGVLRRLIARSLGIKKKMIEVDEFDTGPRNTFNYGHSFGHALESYSNYTVPHGIAVSFGMDIANHVSVALGFLSESACAEMHELLARNFSCTDLGVIELPKYLSLLRKDKKGLDDHVRLILSRGIGDMFITTVSLDDRFSEILTERFRYYSGLREAAV